MIYQTHKVTRSARELLATTVMLLALARPMLAAAKDSPLASAPSGRDRSPMDFNWRFAFGHATDSSRDFDPANNFFTYLAKAGDGVGAAAADFDDRGWRVLNLPHDWAVEVPFSERGSASHGYKAI